MEKETKKLPPKLVDQFAEIQIANEGFYTSIGADEYDEAKYKCAQIAVNYVKEVENEFMDFLKTMIEDYHRLPPIEFGNKISGLRELLKKHEDGK